MRTTRDDVMKMAKKEKSGTDLILDEIFTPYAWPGCYPILFQNDMGEALCASCARHFFVSRDEGMISKDDIAITSDIYYEGQSLTCDVCGVEIDSAYGDYDGNDDEGVL